MALRVHVLVSCISIAIASPLLNRWTNRVTRQGCDDVLYFKNGKYYLVHETTPVPGMPADISVDWQRDNIYFTLVSNEMKMSLQVLYNEDPKRLKTIDVPALGQSTAVDNIRHEIFLATDNGVYKYVNDSIVERYSAAGEDVMYITVYDAGKEMYLATFPHNLVLKITRNGLKSEYFSAIPNGHGLKMDMHGNLYFFTGNVPYVLRKDSQMPIRIPGFKDDSNKLFFTAKNGQTFAMDAASRMYVLSPSVPTAVYVGTFNIADVNAFAMDSENNVIIGVGQSIIKYVGYDQNPCSYKKYSDESDQRL